jgi:hypothetical protein
MQPTRVASRWNLAIWWISANIGSWAATMGAFQALPRGFKPIACVIIASAQWLALRRQASVSLWWMTGTTLAWLGGLWVAADEFLAGSLLGWRNWGRDRRHPAIFDTMAAHVLAVAVGSSEPCDFPDRLGCGCLRGPEYLRGVRRMRGVHPGGRNRRNRDRFGLHSRADVVTEASQGVQCLF